MNILEFQVRNPTVNYSLSSSWAATSFFGSYFSPVLGSITQFGLPLYENLLCHYSNSFQLSKIYTPVVRVSGFFQPRSLFHPKLGPLLPTVLVLSVVRLSNPSILSYKKLILGFIRKNLAVEYWKMSADMATWFEMETVLEETVSSEDLKRFEQKYHTELQEGKVLGHILVC